MTEQENNIIAMIYDAAMDNSMWPKVLQMIVEYLNCKTAIFTALDQLNPHYNFTYSYNIPEIGLRAYQDEKIQLIDMRLHVPMFIHAGVGGVVISNLKSYATMDGTDQYIFYEKCLKPTGIEQVAGLLLDQGQYRWAVLGVHREPNAPLFTEHESSSLKAFGVHLRRALQIHRQFSLAKQQNHEIYQILDHIKIGVVLVEHNASVVMTNSKAQHLIEHCDVLRVDGENCLRVPRQDHPQFEKLIHSAVNIDSSENVGGVMTLQGRDHIRLSIVPLAQACSLIDTTSTAKAVIFLTNLNEQQRLSQDLLKQYYALSNREISICEGFLNGQNLSEIALDLGLTLSSVRTYVKNIYQKMDCTSQVEFMRMLQGLVIDFEHITEH